jgi:hypothetical protein
MADPPTGLWPKFIDCAGQVLPDDDVRRLADVAAIFTDLTDLGTLMDRLQVGHGASWAR